MIFDGAIPPHGGQLHRIAELFGRPVADLLDLSANINPEGPSPLALEALREALKDTSMLKAYPDLEESQLRLAISEYAGVAVEMIAVANGFVPLLDAALRVFAIGHCLMPVPAFGEYRSALERAGVQVTPHILDQTKDFHYQPDKLLATLRAGHHDSILLANPQNPSGVLCEGVTLNKFLEETAKLNVRVFLDEAFIDYAPTHSMAKQASRFPNLIVFRSVTKFHGCPGLRVAYVVVRSAMARAIHQTLAPWAITTLAAVAVRAALADASYSKRMIRLNDDRKGYLVAQLKRLGLTAYPAAANFVLIQFRSANDADRIWKQLIRGYGIVLRHCGNFAGLAPNHLRCAVLGDAENTKLLKALAQILVA